MKFELSKPKENVLGTKNMTSAAVRIVDNTIVIQINTGNYSHASLRLSVEVTSLIGQSVTQTNQ